MHAEILFSNRLWAMAHKGEGLNRAGARSHCVNKPTTDVRCPVCGSETVHHCPAPNWGEMRRCLSCGLVLANPMPLPESSTLLFDKAYRGEVSTSGLRRYATRLKFRDELKSLGMDVQNTGKRPVMHWLKSNIAAGSVVVDIGCGLGLLMSDLRGAGFRPVGVDVSEELVKMLQKEGYQVWLGNVRNIPPDWAEPAACTCLYVLHHSPDPIGFLSDIRHRFPHASLLLSESAGGWGRGRTAVWFPPGTLTWWTAQALRIALEQAGYSAHTISAVSVESSEFGIPGLLNLYRAFNGVLHLQALAPYYFKLKKVLFAPWAAAYRMMGRHPHYLATSVPAPQAEEK